MQMIVFGYGSLMDPRSLARTVPAAKTLRPVFITGFQRDFSYWCPDGFTTSHLDVAGQPFAALNIHASATTIDRVNGVCFTVESDELEALILREVDYEMIQTTYYDYETAEPLGTCTAFSSAQHLEQFVMDSPAQLRYLQICLDGAESQGADFYQEFLETTRVNGKLLAAWPELDFAWLTPGPYQPN